MNERTFTKEQAETVRQYQEMHGIEPSQISFDEDNTSPSFDHIAISVLSLKLTDIQDISPTEIRTEAETGLVTVFARTTLPDGRSRGSIGSCQIGEVLANGETVTTGSQASGVATSRAFRQGIRNVGIDLHAAHRRYVETGSIAAGHTRRDPRATNYAELHVLASELDLIIDGNKTKYHEYLAENFDGRTSSKDLTDIELQRLLITFRSLSRLSRKTTGAAA